MNSNINKMNRLNIHDFSHFFVQTKQIKQICKEYFENDNKELTTLLISGPTSCGKTSLINLLLNDFKFDVMEVSPTSYPNITQLKEKLKQFCNFRSVLSFDKTIKKVCSYSW